MTNEEQLRQWVAGNPIHNDEHPAGIEGGECCPDFSCCNPELLAPKAIREEFAAARAAGDDKKVNRMLVAFLSTSLENWGCKVVTSEDVSGGYGEGQL
jgi:hypothetical protein